MSEDKGETWVKIPPDHPVPLPVSILFGDEALEWKADFCRMRRAVQGLDAAVTSIGHSLSTIAKELQDMSDNKQTMHSIAKSLEQISIRVRNSSI